MPQNLWISIEEYRIQADLYALPEQPIQKIMIMGHGLGGEKSCGLTEFAEYYQNLGFAVCIFDYRGFGKSTGAVKNLVDKNSQIKDWQAVIAYIKQNFNLTNQDIVLWGYSFSGAHVLSLASETSYKAIIANFPHVDGLASLTLYPKKFLLPATIIALQDLALARFGKIKTMPVVSKNRFAILAGEDCFNAYYSIIPKHISWDNAVPARIVATIGLYRPTTIVNRIQCPVLVTSAAKDSLIPIQATRKMALKNSNIQYFEHHCGHFDLFHLPFKNQILEQHQQFLNALD